MTVVVVILSVAAASASLLATAMAFAVHRGDPAGNGLGQAYLVVALGLAWLLVAGAVVAAVLTPASANCPAEMPWPTIDVATFGALALGITSPIASLPYLCDARPRGLWRALVRANLFLVPAALLAHAAWRVPGLPLPAGMALQGCAALVAGGAVLPWLARARAAQLRRAALRQPTLQSVVYPALLVQPRARATVVRNAAEADGLPAAWFSGDTRWIDANGRPWTMRSGPPTPVLVRSGDPMPFPAICELLLGVPRLHEDAVEQARIRRLIPQQRDVTALTFLLPR